MTVDIREQLGLEPLAELNKYINMLIYGEWNAGKTFLCGTAQDHKETSPVLHLGFEQGLLTVAYRSDYDAKEIRTIEELEKVVSILDADLSSKTPRYKTVIIDNATELQSLDIDTIMRQTKNTARDASKVDIDIPSPREWGKLRKRLRRCVQAFRDMPVHTIWTAWRGAAQDPNNEKLYNYYPKLDGSIKEEMGGYFDIVGYLKKDWTNNVATRGLQVVETERVKAKWRNKPESVPSVIVEPTIPMIWEFIKQTQMQSD